MSTTSPAVAEDSRQTASGADGVANTAVAEFDFERDWNRAAVARKRGQVADRVRRYGASGRPSAAGDGRP